MFVFTLYQDHRGYVWAGTYDGLNRFNGSSVTSYGIGANGKDQLSGNLIERIHEEKDGILWIHTNLGFDRFDTSKGQVEYHPEIHGSYRSVVSPSGEVIVFKGDNCYYYYNQAKKHFYRQQLKGIKYSDIQALYIDDKHNITIYTVQAKKVGHLIKRSDGFINIVIDGTSRFQTDINKTYLDGSIAYHFSADGTIYQTDSHQQNTKYVCHLPEDIQKRGEISCIVRDGEDLLIGFYDNGAVRMKYNPMAANHYTAIDFGLSARVYDIKKDKRQNIIWIATDGNGVYCYIQEEFSFINFPLSKVQMKNPLRAVFKDAKDRIWIGTKGDGIMQLPHGLSFGKENPVYQHYTLENSELRHNSVYCFSPSKRNIFWIGTGDREPFLNYFSFRDNRIHTIHLPEDQRFTVTDMVEADKNELWIASGGNGVYRLTLSGSDDAPVVESLKQMLYDDSTPGKAQFSAIKHQGNIIWTANRENGIFRIDRRTGKTIHILLNRIPRSPLNDVLSLETSVSGKIYCGTTAGLVELSTATNQVRNISKETHLGNFAIRSLLHVGQFIWGATSHGLLLYHTRTGVSNYYTSDNGIEAFEYCDRAAFYDAKSGKKYFGSTNELLEVSRLQEKKKFYHPDINFLGVTVNGNDYSIASLSKNKKLVLDYSQNFFSVHFNALDYIHESDYTFYYRLKEVGEEWISNGNNRTIAFTNLSPGNYTLQLYYQNGKYKSPVYEQPLRILPPWYASTVAKILYWFLLIAGIVVLIRNYMLRQKRREKQLIKDLEKQRKEEVYESKLSFFTNICHEFCTPLTLIGGPCQRILSYERTDGVVKNYASLIQRNSIRLNELIQELIEFRRVDTEHRQMNIEKVNVEESTQEIAASFHLMAEQKAIHYQILTTGQAEWNTDRSAWTTIVTNLVSNAFKYTPENGEIQLRLHTTDDELKLEVENTGKGILPEDLQKVFNRYEIIQNLEQQNSQGEIRNGIGLALCQGLVHLLHGQIDVKSTPGKTTCFSVTLPKVETSGQTENISSSPTVSPILSSRMTEKMKVKEMSLSEIDPSRPTVVVVDDNQEMLWFLHDYLSDCYNLLVTDNPQTALEQFNITNISLVITDLVMKPFDGIELCKRIKENESTRHIPVIVLSAIHDDKQRIFAINAGADLYIAKPFDIAYLRTMVESLLRRNNTLKEYFSSSLSVFELVKGRVLHKEDKALLEQMLHVINENITNSNLTTKFVADKMGLGVRNLYRRLETITDETPTTIIRNARLERARQLITTTGHTMEEVCYKAGFTNRGTFYKLFAARYGCTPKQYHDNQTAQVKNNLSQKR